MNQIGLYKFSLLVIVFIGGLMGVVNQTSANSSIKAIQLTIEEGKQEFLKELIGNFANEEGFDVSISQVHPDSRFYVADLKRSDCEIIVLNPRDPNTFEVGLYFSENNQIQSSDAIIMIFNKLIHIFQQDSRFKVKILK